MGKTRNHYLVRQHMDDEEMIVLDNNQDYDDIQFEEDEYLPRESKKAALPKPTEPKNDTPKNQPKEWSGEIKKGIPSLYELAFNALLPKTKMALVKYGYPHSNWD